jgi:hypothetical protein
MISAVDKSAKANLLLQEKNTISCLISQTDRQPAVLVSREKVMSALLAAKHTLATA